MEKVPLPVPDQATQNWKVVLSYDGTDYRGWQVQPGHATIQGELAAAIERICGETVLPQGSGRTDAGVHALAQVASFALHAAIPAANLKRALNHALPSAIRILAAEHVHPDFHARHSATGKTYEYRVLLCDSFRGEVCDPWLARYVYVQQRPVDLAAMAHAAACVLGMHDFTSFAASDSDITQRSSDPASEPRTSLRTITESAWMTSLHEGKTLLSYRIAGNGFLHHMVRNLVGTFLECGTGERDPHTLPTILQARSRSSAGRTAPARGLFLHHVEYQL